MFLIDIVLLILLGAFVIKGIKDGFIDALCSMVAIGLGLYAASLWYSLGAHWLMKFTGWGVTFSNILAFIIIFIIINRLVSWILYLGQRFLDVIAKLPVIKSLNTLAGGLFGLVSGILVLGLVISSVQRFGQGSLAVGITHSVVAGYILKICSFIVPYLSRAILHI